MCPVLADGTRGHEEPAPIHIADVVRMMGNPPSDEQLRLHLSRQELANELAAKQRGSKPSGTTNVGHKRPRATL